MVLWIYLAMVFCSVLLMICEDDCLDLKNSYWLQMECFELPHQFVIVVLQLWQCLVVLYNAWQSSFKSLMETSGHALKCAFCLCCQVGTLSVHSLYISANWSHIPLPNMACKTKRQSKGVSVVGTSLRDLPLLSWDVVSVATTPKSRMPGSA